MKNLACYLLLFLIPFSANCSKEENIQNQQIRNLVAFSKSYGYIRYFHPSNESRIINWDTFLLYGIPKVAGCKSNNEIKDSLTNLFNPISTLVNFYLKKPSKFAKQPYKLTDTLVFHQYRGIKTSDRSYLGFKDYQVRISNNSFIDSSLFNSIPNYRENYCDQLISDVFINFPLVRKYDPHKRVNDNFYQPISNDMDLPITKEKIKILADIIAFWNIVQHFYPYHAESGMNWEQTLESIVGRVLNDPKGINSGKYIFMLGKEMKDGHFRVTNYFKQGFNLPIDVRLLNSIPVVIESFDTTIFKKGDVLRTINHKPVAFLIDSVKSYRSGSDEFVNCWSRNDIHRSENSDEVTVELLRGKKVLSLSVKRAYFERKPKSKFLDKGIYYCDLADNNCNMDTLISIAGNTDAIILDWRNGSDIKLLVHKLFQHLTNDALPSPFRFMTPQMVYPNHKIETYYEPKESIPPLKPRISTKIVILSSPANMSYQESIIKMAQLNNLATIVGETTGGVQGSINYSTLPNGLVVGWTGMKVVNLDGSQYHLKGIKPNILVTTTLEGLKAGKDEVLDKALEYLKTE
jgi:hypothetical protein